jgi:hypothetical protein
MSDSGSEVNAEEAAEDEEFEKTDDAGRQVILKTREKRARKKAEKDREDEEGNTQ